MSNLVPREIQKLKWHKAHISGTMSLCCVSCPENWSLCFLNNKMYHIIFIFQITARYIDTKGSGQLHSCALLYQDAKSGNFVCLLESTWSSKMRSYCFHDPWQQAKDGEKFESSNKNTHSWGQTRWALPSFISSPVGRTPGRWSGQP